MACLHKYRTEAQSDSRSKMGYASGRTRDGWALLERADSCQTCEAHHRSIIFLSWAWWVGEIRVNGFFEPTEREGWRQQTEMGHVPASLLRASTPLRTANSGIQFPTISTTAQRYRSFALEGHMVGNTGKWS
jgi:hypothetical protein